MPVTSPLNAGITTAEVAVLKIDRQPRWSVSGGSTLLQVFAPTKSCPSAPMSMRLWYPSVISAVLRTDLPERSTTLNVPQFDAAPVVQGVPGAVPATYNSVPSRNPIVAAGTGILPRGSTVGGVVVMSTICLLYTS